MPQWRFTSAGKPGPATRLVFDLDPGEDVTMRQLCEVAHAVRELMDDIGLPVYPASPAGARGCTVCPLADTPVSSSGASVLARRVAQQLEQSMPKLVTATMTKSLRTGKVLSGLEPEQRGEDHDRAVLVARARASDGGRAADVGREFDDPRTAAIAINRGAAPGSPSTATCSPNSTTRRAARTG